MNILLLLLQFLPSLLQAIFQLKGQPGLPGVSKKEIIMHTLDVAGQFGQSVPNVLVQAIGVLVDKIVGTVNAADQPTVPVPPPVKP